MTIEDDFEAAQRVVSLVASGSLVNAIARGQTAAADWDIVFDKAIDTLQAAKLAMKRTIEAAQIVKEGLT
jgi:hypothetical protein